MPKFDVQYAVVLGKPRLPAIEETLIIAPPCCWLIIVGRTSLLIRKLQVGVVTEGGCHRSSDNLRSGTRSAPRAKAELLIRKSIRPNSLSVDATVRFSSCVLTTSTIMGRLRRPVCRTWSAVLS